MRSAAFVHVILLSLSLTSVAASITPSNTLVARHDDHHEDMDETIPWPMESSGSSAHEELAHDMHMPSVTPVASSTAIPDATVISASIPPESFAQAHSHGGHDHGSHAAPKDVLDDADIHNWHDFPPSYLAADFRLDNDSAIFGEVFDETWDAEDASGHVGLAMLHAGMELVAYFGILPIALALHAADHPFYHLVNIVFVLVAVLGWLVGLAYDAATPDRYEGAIHAKLGTALIFLSIALVVIDSLSLIKRAIKYYRQSKHDRFHPFSWSALFKDALQTAEEYEGSRYEMVGLTADDRHSQSNDDHRQTTAVFSIEDEYEEQEVQSRNPLQPSQSGGVRPTPLLLQERGYSSSSRNSTGSEGTLHENRSPTTSSSGYVDKLKAGTSGFYDVHERMAFPVADDEQHEVRLDPQSQSRKMTPRRFAGIALTWIRRLQVVLAYVLILTGVTTYTGMCRGSPRASFLPGCAAHYIKGSIFFGYGVITFARYLGAYADLGWAWNKRPDGRHGPTAEMVECGVIFFYGITNTWMERFGAAPGDPYTVKQVQHISIAVMFWFAGLSGMLLESKKMRSLLATIAGKRQERDEPPSYSFSFNPLPALVIAVTGLAMAAHHQEYTFQVSIHSLWGILLAGGSLFRFLTYFFLYLRPPTSALPSRPPTEILASFGYAAGGIVFILSVEEISFAAMRAGYDDMMAFLNFTVALTSLVFCWIMVVLGVKGWAVGRVQRDKERGTGNVGVAV